MHMKVKKQLHRSQNWFENTSTLFCLFLTPAEIYQLFNTYKIYADFHENKPNQQRLGLSLCINLLIMVTILQTPKQHFQSVHPHN